MDFTRFLSVPLVIVGLGMAQTVTITGRVLENAAKDPVPGATVTLKGYNLTTTTDSLGNFTLSGNPTSCSLARWIGTAVPSWNMGD